MWLCLWCQGTFTIQRYKYMHPGVWLFSPAEHEHVVGGGIIWQGHELLKTELLTATIKPIRTVCTHGVVIATWSVLHRPQAFGTLYRNQKGIKKRHWVTMKGAKCIGHKIASWWYCKMKKKSTNRDYHRSKKDCQLYNNWHLWDNGQTWQWNKKRTNILKSYKFWLKWKTSTIF